MQRQRSCPWVSPAVWHEQEGAAGQLAAEKGGTAPFPLQSPLPRLCTERRPHLRHMPRLCLAMLALGCDWWLIPSLNAIISIPWSIGLVECMLGATCNLMLRQAFSEAYSKPYTQNCSNKVAAHIRLLPPKRKSGRPREG